ncbi:MAG: hypothetical protein WD294_12780 [Phycisphaeraceae bacterium]
MDKNSGEPQSTGRRRFFRQFLASAIDGVEELGRGLNEAKREIEAQRQAWQQPQPRYDTTHWTPPERYGPPWPPPYGPPIPKAVRQNLRKLQEYYYTTDTVSRGEA